MPVAPRMAYYDDYKKNCMFLSAPGAEDLQNTSALSMLHHHIQISGEIGKLRYKIWGDCAYAKQGCNPLLYANQTVSSER